MRLQILSDFHLEFYQKGFPLIKPCAKYLFLAGDIGNLSSLISSQNLKNFFDHVSQNWKKCFYVTGNHEYYHPQKNKDQLDLEYQTLTQSYPNIHFLNFEKEPLILEDEKVEILGCTLWSKPQITDRFNDFRSIRNYDPITQTNQPIKLTNMFEWNAVDSTYLKEHLNKKTKYKRIVMTHFLPLTNLEIPNSKYGYNPCDASYFGNQFHDLVPLADLWISGHTHEIFKTMIGSTLWVGNPYGYPRENKIKNDGMVFEI